MKLIFNSVYCCLLPLMVHGNPMPNVSLQVVTRISAQNLTEGNETVTEHNRALNSRRSSDHIDNINITNEKVPLMIHGNPTPNVPVEVLTLIAAQNITEGNETVTEHNRTLNSRRSLDYIDNINVTDKKVTLMIHGNPMPNVPVQVVTLIAAQNITEGNETVTEQTRTLNSRSLDHIDNLKITDEKVNLSQNDTELEITERNKIQNSSRREDTDYIPLDEYVATPNPKVALGYRKSGSKDAVSPGYVPFIVPELESITPPPNSTKAILRQGGIRWIAASTTRLSWHAWRMLHLMHKVGLERPFEIPPDRVGQRVLEGIPELRTIKDCHCPHVYYSVCGSDGVTYVNECIMNCMAIDKTYVKNHKHPLTKYREGPCIMY